MGSSFIRAIAAAWLNWPLLVSAALMSRKSCAASSLFPWRISSSAMFFPSGIAAGSLVSSKLLKLRCASSSPFPHAASAFAMVSVLESCLYISGVSTNSAFTSSGKSLFVRRLSANPLSRIPFGMSVSNALPVACPRANPETGALTLIEASSINEGIYSEKVSAVSSLK